LSISFTEDELIARLFAPMAGPGGLGLKDDAALLTPPPGHDLVLTTDAIIAGVHYFAGDAPESIARKALRVNLSDLAAKGADPLGFLLTLALPGDLPAGWLEAFAKALGEDAKTYGIELLGGDTVKTPGPTLVSITALGCVPSGRMVSRMGARVGDLIYVSGTIGDAAIALKLRLDESAAPFLSRNSRDALAKRYLEPQPRNKLAQAMRENAHGGMDVSDGFVGDVTKMLAASGVSARVDLRLVPLSAAAREACDLDLSLFDVAMTGGDDYELLASVPPTKATAFEATANAAGVSVARVGEVVAGTNAPVFTGVDGAPKSFARGSFSHF
jgi:thiamine-monophosphate kinase